MIQFNISGQYLELPADFDLQFTKSNILFAFDDIECERSTSFDIPDTPKNNAIFRVSKDMNYRGDGMRMRYNAQMQSGVVVKNGYLYIDSYDYENGVYKAIFVTGELFGILRLKEAEDISTFFDRTELPTAVYNKIVTSTPGDFGTVRYFNDTDSGGAYISPLYPSINANRIITTAMQKLGIVYGIIPTSNGRLYLTPDSLKLPDGKDAALGNTVYMADNLPKVSLLELLRTIAIVNGKMLYYGDDGTGTERLYFDDVNTSTWKRIDVDGRVIAKRTIKRSIGEYGADNYIVSDSKFGNEITGNGSINICVRPSIGNVSSIYHTDNENLIPTHELYHIPFDGGIDIYSECVLFLRQNGFGISLHKDSDLSNLIPIGSAESGRMQTNTTIAKLFAESTQIEIDVWMSLFEYESITAKTKLLYHGAEWVWTEAQYSKGVAKFILNKIQ